MVPQDQPLPPSQLRRAAAVMMLLASLALSVPLLFGAFVLDGRGGPSIQCYRAAELAGSPSIFRTSVDGDWSLVPLGVVCRYTDEIGRVRVVSHTSWGSTGVLALLAAAGFAGAVLLVAPTSRKRVRRASPHADPDTVTPDTGVR